jgi:hypothetical protein
MTEHPGGAPRLSLYRWSDAEGTPLALGCRIEQIAVDQVQGAMRSRLHQQGLVIGWDTTWLHVCFDHDRMLVVLRTHLVRVLDADGSRRPG